MNKDEIIKSLGYNWIRIESWLIDPKGEQTFVYLPDKELVYGLEEKIDSQVLVGFEFILEGSLG